jgi:hypothetical protein
MTSRDDAPIACTLGGNDYRERLAWIAQLNRDGLRSHRRDAMTLELHYAATVRDRVYQLVRQEADLRLPSILNGCFSVLLRSTR